MTDATSIVSGEAPRSGIRGRVQSWIFENRLQLTACFVSALFVLASAEAAIRVLGSNDEDGNFQFGGRRLRPYRMPLKRVASAVERYKQSRNTMIVYDAEVGWRPRPGGRNEESIHNASGLRVEAADRMFDRQPKPGTVRIALFGDSFVYGSEVTYSDTWAFGVARLLEASGTTVEVLNFGVPGYGTDQAYLRWNQSGAEYMPNVVVFGLQLENMHRNVNLFRPFYIPVVDLPFSKPRFIDRQGRWELINRPAAPPDELPKLIERFERWEWHQHEEFFKPDRYEPKWWLHSRLLGFAVPAFLERTGSARRDDELTPEKQNLTFRILSEFAKAVESRGGRFVVVHLPTRSDLESLSSNGELPLPGFLERVRERFGLIDPADDLIRRANDVSMAALFRPGGHYTAAGNAVVADGLARHIVQRPR